MKHIHSICRGISHQSLAASRSKCDRAVYLHVCVLDILNNLNDHSDYRSVYFRLLKQIILVIKGKLYINYYGINWIEYLGNWRLVFGISHAIISSLFENFINMNLEKYLGHKTEKSGWCELGNSLLVCFDSVRVL